MAFDMLPTQDTYLFSLHVSAWSGRGKLSRADLNPNTLRDLPPEKLAALGQKKLIDPELLKPMIAVKTKALAVLNHMGIKLLNGWLVHKSNLTELMNTLSQYTIEYEDLAKAFCDSYIDSAQAWAANFPEWRDMLLSALPSQEKMQRKFNFSFTAYELIPNTTDIVGNKSVEVLRHASSAGYEQIKEDLITLLEGSFKDSREVFKISALRPLASIADKARNFAFTDPAMGVLAGFLDSLYSSYKDDVKDPARMNQVRLILKALTQEENFEELVHNNISQSTAPEDLLMGVIQSAPARDPEPAPAQAPEPEPVVTDASAEALAKACKRKPTPAPAQPAPAQPEPEPESTEIENNSAYSDILASLGL